MGASRSWETSESVRGENVEKEGVGIEWRRRCAEERGKH